MGITHVFGVAGLGILASNAPLNKGGIRENRSGRFCLRQPKICLRGIFEAPPKCRLSVDTCKRIAYIEP